MSPVIPFLLTAILAWQPAASPAPPPFSVNLYADHAAVTPGGDVELAVELVVPKGWYIYHPLVLDTGLPTTLTFTLPEGLHTGPLRFPTPTLKVTTEGKLELEYLSLSGPVRVLTTLHADPDIGPGPLRVTVAADGLACRRLCVPVHAEAVLTLPVSDQPAAPTNAELFEAARAALPAPLEKAEFLTGSRLLAAHTRVPVGGRSELVAQIRVQKGYHIQDRDPGVQDLIGTRLFVESRPGIELGDQVWPKPHERFVPLVGKVREQSGTFLIRVPFAVDPDSAEPGPVRLRALLQYQCCADDGSCFPPAFAEGWFEFEIVPADKPAVSNEDPALADLASSDVTPGTEPKNEPTATAGPPAYDLWMLFLAAFVGGAILNIMPCVLPVISLKIFGFVQQAGEDRGRIFRMGLVYAAGIMTSFAVLAVLMVTAGMAWGGLMQRPEFMIGLTAVVFAFALSLLGVFELQLPGTAANVAGEAASREGYGGAFVNGILATLLATPCVGPLLGSAIGVLTQLPPAIAGSGIMVVGLGLATPYVLLTAFPGWLRFLPKPGPWMVTFKQIVGFILVAVVLWLLTILSKLVTAEELLAVLGLLASVSVGCWLLGKITLTATRRRNLALWTAAVAVTALGGWGSFRLFTVHDQSIPWQDWEPGLAEKLAAEGYTVYIDYTATWCLTCQTNKALVLHTDDVAQAFRKLGVYPIKADFTNRNPVMQKELQSHGRNGVPTNVIYPAGRPDAPILLPELLGKQTVLDALAEAGPSQKKPPFWTESP